MVLTILGFELGFMGGMSPNLKKGHWSLYVPKWLMTKVTYLAGSDAYKVAWLGSAPKMCFVMAPAMSFLFFPDGLSPGRGLMVEIDVEQLWNRIWWSAIWDVIQLTSWSMQPPLHTIFTAGFFIGLVVDNTGSCIGRGMGAAVWNLPPLARCFTWAAGALFCIEVVSRS